MKYDIIIGCTVNAYARVEIDAKGDADLRGKLVQLLRAGAQDLTFTPEWGDAGYYRICKAEDDAGDTAFDFDDFDSIKEEAEDCQG